MMTSKIRFPGWTFNYDSAAQTAFEISLNGFITFDTLQPNFNGGGGVSYGYINSYSFSNGKAGRIIAAMYDDLSCGANYANWAAVDSSVKYQFDGTVGNHTLTVEWRGMSHYADGTSNLNFQIKLYESNSCIEFIYGIMNPTTGTFSYSLGLNSNDTPYVSTAQLLTQQTPNTTNFNYVPQDWLTILPDSFTMLSFCPALATGGIDNSSAKNLITIFPNPASSLLTIHQTLATTNQQVIITDVLGNKVLAQALNNAAENNIDISLLSNGIYFYEVRYSSTQASTRGKFVKD